MRRTWMIALTTLLAVGLIGPAGALTDALDYPVPGVSVTSDNVEHVGYLAEAGPSVSARVVEVAEGDRRLYVSSIARGLSIYDINDPASPMIMGTLPIAGFQNEDMAVSIDGDIAIIAYDTGGANWFLDTSDPAVPRVASVTTPGDHTIECVVPDCSVAYGSSGRTFDLSDLDDVQVVTPGWRDVAASQGINFSQGGHAVHRDPQTGYVLTDTVPRLILDVSENPFEPEVVSEIRLVNRDALQYQHNALWPRSEDYTPRTAENADDPDLQPGELLMITGETNARPSCDGATNGPFATMDIRGWDSGETIQRNALDIYRPPANSTYLDGNPAVNGLGCSAHWFNWTYDTASDSDDYMVALAAFEHGARFLAVDAATGKIDEVGWFQPFNGSAGAAYWVGDYVFVVDYVRGVDILRFNHDVDLRPSDDAVAASWLASAGRTELEVTRAERMSCLLAAQR